MVPRGWCLPMGNVSMLFHLWVNGNASMRLAPYRFLKGWDLQATEESCNLPLVLSPERRAKALATRTQTWRTYLSQATDVMVVIAQHANTTFTALAALQASERERMYIDAFTSMCKALHPDLSDASLDARRMHEASYLTVYSALSKLGMLRRRNGKRKQAPRPEEESESDREES